MPIYLHRALEFLIEFLFGVYILLFLVRLILGYSQTNYRNPLAMALVTVTAPPVQWLRRVLPKYCGAGTCILIILFVLQFMELVFLYQLKGMPMTLPGGVLLSLTELLKSLIHIYLFSIIVMAVMSWINPGTQSPLLALLIDINVPILYVLHRVLLPRVLPPRSHFDLSPMIICVLLYLTLILVHDPLHDQAMLLMRP